MNVWLASIERRKDEGSTFGPFASREGAVQAVRDYVTRRLRPESIAACNAEFGGDLTEGTFYSEEETIEVYERTLEP